MMCPKKTDKCAIEDEQKLIRRCIEGDPDAWDEFVDAYKGLIYHTILKTLQVVGYRNAREVSGDIFQEVFSRLLSDDHAKLKSFRWKNKCTLAYWVGVVTKNLTYDFIRKTFSRNKVIACLQEGSDPERKHIDRASLSVPSFIKEIEEKEKLSYFQKALVKLPEKDLRLMELFYYRALPNDLVALMLDKSVDAVLMRRKRVVDKLKKSIKKMLCDGFVNECS